MLSVITIAPHYAGQCRMALESLARQSVADQLEVVVLAPDLEGWRDEWMGWFRSCRWVRVEQEQTFGTLMARGVAESTGDYVTYAEEHGYFEPDWAAWILDAHQRGYSVVGFAMRNANPGTLTSWAHLYGQFGPVVDPVESGETSFLAGHHVSYARRLFPGDSQQVAACWEDECAYFLYLKSVDEKLYLEGRAVSYHFNISGLKHLMYLDFLGQRSFAESRARLQGWTWRRRLLYALACPLVPWLRTARAVYHMVRTGRTFQLLPQALAPLACTFGAGMLGEAMGYVFGAAQAPQRKLLYELQRIEVMSAGDDARQVLLERTRL